MGRHKEIETILLCELTTNEERSQRAIEMIEYQQDMIHKLEKKLEEQRIACEALTCKKEAASSKDYAKILCEIVELREMLGELSEIQKDIILEIGEQQREEVSEKEQNISVQIPTIVQPNDIQPVLNSLSTMLQKIHDILQNKNKNEVTDKVLRTLDSLNDRVEYLDQERNETFATLQELCLWTKHMDAMILDMSTGVNVKSNVETESGDMLRQMWATARRYFTAEESSFFISAFSNP